jgi:hypothetical protein
MAEWPAFTSPIKNSLRGERVLRADSGRGHLARAVQYDGSDEEQLMEIQWGFEEIRPADGSLWCGRRGLEDRALYEMETV